MQLNHEMLYSHSMNLQQNIVIINYKQLKVKEYILYEKATNIK